MLHCVLYKYMFMGNDRNVYVKKKPSKVTELIWKDLFILSWLLVGSYFLFFGKIYVLHYWSLLFIDFSSLELLLNIEPYHKINDIHLLRMLFDHFSSYRNRYYYWNTITDQVCWLSPVHPRANITVSAQRIQGTDCKLWLLIIIGQVCWLMIEPSYCTVYFNSSFWLYL